MAALPQTVQHGASEKVLLMPARHNRSDSARHLLKTITRFLTLPHFQHRAIYVRSGAGRSQTFFSASQRPISCEMASSNEASEALSRACVETPTRNVLNTAASAPASVPRSSSPAVMARSTQACRRAYPGYAFSGRPRQPLGPRAIVFLFDKLMARLGYDRYLVHSGDWGAHITSLLGFHLPQRVIGIHSTALALREAGAEQLSGEVPSDATDEQQAFVAAESAIWRREGAYSQLHATKPAKLGYAMMDSPVGTAAWIVEAFHAWSDRRERSFEELFTSDQLLTEVMLYLVTDAFPTSTWIYGAKQHEEMTLPPGQRVTVPTGLAAFPDPVFPMPPRQVAQRSHDVVQYTEMPHGGHFPFYEAPDLLIDDLRKFRQRVVPAVLAEPSPPTTQ